MQQLLLYSRANTPIFTLLDDADYNWALQWRWRLNSKGYAIRSITVESREVVLSLHRELLKPAPGLVVDHVDHNRLNNTRANLRIITQSENLANRRIGRNNSTGFKGVNFQHGKWHARIQKDGQEIHLGHYDDLKTAALTYDCAARWLYGVCANTNLPDSPIPVEIERRVRFCLCQNLVADQLAKLDLP